MRPPEEEAQLAQAAMHFIRKSTLHGDEVVNYVAVHNWLQEKMDAIQPENVRPENA